MGLKQEPATETPTLSDVVLKNPIFQLPLSRIQMNWNSKYSVLVVIEHNIVYTFDRRSRAKADFCRYDIGDGQLRAPMASQHIIADRPLQNRFLHSHSKTADFPPLQPHVLYRIRLYQKSN